MTRYVFVTVVRSGGHMAQVCLKSGGVMNHVVQHAIETLLRMETKGTAEIRVYSGNDLVNYCYVGFDSETRTARMMGRSEYLNTIAPYFEDMDRECKQCADGLVN